MDTEYRIGDYVLYKNEKICAISDVVLKSFSGIGERYFYMLTPVNEKRTTLYIPVDSTALTSTMRAVLSTNEVNEVIDASINTELRWIDDVKERAVKYGEMVIRGNRAELLCIARMLSEYKVAVEQNKKKLYASDLKLLASVEKMITEEFAFSLGLDQDEVVPYIVERCSV